MRQTSEQKQNGNGKGKYNPEVYYRHLGVDVWEKQTPESKKTEVAYSEEILEELSDSENIEDSDPNNNQN